MDRQPVSQPAVATLFGELVELTHAERVMRLEVLARDMPAVARELRALLDVDAVGRDFFGLHTIAPDAAARVPLDTDDLHDGDIVGPYRLLREIGRGGMGAVWLAHDGRLDRHVALKFVRLPATARTAEAIEARRAVRSRFLIEARAAASIDHPNVAGIFDVGGGNTDRLFIAMQYCAGGSLAQKLAAGAMPATEASRIAAEIAAGLAAAHARDVIHRDIKPANVLFDTAGAARLSDFGIALLPGSDITRSGMVMGTLAYLAPEQLRGERADHRSDLWALGVTLYEMLSGTRPFAGESHAAVMYAVLHAPQVPLASLVSDAPASLIALVDQLLAKSPADRPQSASQVEAMLRSARAATSTRQDIDLGARSQLSEVAAAPVHLTPLVGRARELGLVRRLLADTRLLTLTGAGGSGKTRLASETALRVTGDGDGDHLRSAWVDLTPLVDESLVPAQIAAALRVPELPGRTRLEAVAETLGDASLLLVLDNCEHVVAAAAQAAETLLQRCANLQILATSREALAISGETTWLVPAMPEFDARELFAQRAQSVQPGFALTEENSGAVDDICRRLDGIPLAIELAAARVRIMTPEQILARLDNAFQLLTGGVRTALPRHRTLRGTMEWSHELLVPRDRVLLRRLAVFAGGFSMAAAEAICADHAADTVRVDDSPTLLADDILDGVSSLVDKSLIVLDADGVALRYRLLETVRQYALERLGEAGERYAYELSHARHFVQAMEGVAPQLLAGEHEFGVMEALIPDHDNVRAATSWSVQGESGDITRTEIALRFAGTLFWYWHSAAGWLGTAQYSEAMDFVTRALLRGADASPLLRGNALATSGFINLSAGNWERSVQDTERALELLREHGTPENAAFVQAALAASYLMLGSLDDAEAHARASYGMARTLAVPVLRTFSTSWVGLVARARGDLVAARANQEENATFSHQIGHPASISHSEAFLGSLNLDEGRIEEAAENFRVSLPIHLRLRDGWGLALDLEGLSSVAAGRGDYMDAARLQGAVDAWRERVGLGVPTFELPERQRRVLHVRSQLGDAYDVAYAEGRRLTPAEAGRRVLRRRESETFNTMQFDPTAAGTRGAGAGASERRRSQTPQTQSST
ncbi:MAG: protein kinase [Gemmatimonadaceae bacterium]|nr:protein kinase [Gemmatimonadaceae bacterium]